MDKTDALLDSLTPTQQCELEARLEARKSNAREFAEQRQSILGGDQHAQLYTVDLSTAATESNPFEISFPFKSLWVYSATDTDANANLHLHSKKIPNIRHGIPIKKNWSANFPATVATAYLTFAAQTGKYLYIVVQRGGSIDPGLTISQNSGGVTISEGSAASLRTSTGLTLTGGAASIISPADTSRNTETLENHTGATLYLGDANVTGPAGAYPGITFAPGDKFVWKNTAALYAYNPGSDISNAAISRLREV